MKHFKDFETIVKQFGSILKHFEAFFKHFEAFESILEHGKISNLRPATMIFKDGSIYVGSMKDNEFQGQMSDVLFREIYFDGKGIMTQTNGDVYNGDWKLGKRHGKGKMTLANGEICAGEWEYDNFLRSKTHSQTQLGGYNNKALLNHHHRYTKKRNDRLVSKNKKRNTKKLRKNNT